MPKTKDFINLDYDREKNTGFPELIYAESKTPMQLLSIFKDFEKKLKSEFPIIATRVKNEHYLKLKEVYPNIKYFKEARIISLLPDKKPKPKTNSEAKVRVNATKIKCEIAVVAAGTSDFFVAEEASVLIELYGVKVNKYYDVGVAGINRLLKVVPKIKKADVVICIAGMEGALPSVLSGLITAPIIAVPTSVGYGASYKGISALLTMINSCSLGISVVNIDNGVGAAHIALRIINKINKCTT